MNSGFGILIPQRRWLYWGLAISLIAHVAVFSFYVSVGRRVQEVVHRITFEPAPPPSVFVKPPTATTKTLEFRKVPMPRGWLLRRRAGAVKARVAEVQTLAAIRTDALLDQLNVSEVVPPSLRPGGRVGPRGDIAAAAAGASIAFRFPEPKLDVVAIRGIKEVRNQVDMRLDMLSIENMDTGQYSAMVIQDPSDRRKIKGFVHLAQAYTRVKSYGKLNERTDISLVNLNYLVRALEQYTGIRADYRGAVPLDDPNLLEIPWLLLPPNIGNLNRSSLTQAELENLGRYIVGGGFALARIPANSASKSAIQRRTGIFDVLRQAMKTQHLNEGSDWRFVVLQPDHPIYHAFFDFDSSVHENQMDVHSANNPLTKDMGLVVGDRLAVFLYSSREIASKEGTLGELSTHVTQGDATRSLQFSVNTVVFALTQEGSVTQQLMSGIR